MRSGVDAEVVLDEEERLPLLGREARRLQRLLERRGEVVHVVLQVVERERALRVEGRDVVQLVVADVRAELDHVLALRPRDCVRELVRVRHAALGEVAEPPIVNRPVMVAVGLVGSFSGKSRSRLTSERRNSLREVRAEQCAFSRQGEVGVLEVLACRRTAHPKAQLLIALSSTRPVYVVAARQVVAVVELVVDRTRCVLYVLGETMLMLVWPVSMGTPLTSVFWRAPEGRAARVDGLEERRASRAQPGGWPPSAPARAVRSRAPRARRQSGCGSSCSARRPAAGCRAGRGRRRTSCP